MQYPMLLAPNAIVVSTNKQVQLGNHIMHAPFTYRASHGDACCYRSAWSISAALNRLVPCISQEVLYRRYTLAENRNCDSEFTDRLFELLSAPLTDSGLIIHSPL